MLGGHADANDLRVPKYAALNYKAHLLAREERSKQRCMNRSIARRSRRSSILRACSTTAAIVHIGRTGRDNVTIRGPAGSETRNRPDLRAGRSALGVRYG
jgi:hypothetical protein